MACSKCKKKSLFKEELEKSTDLVGTGILVFFIIWSLFAGYGIYSLISKFL
jgi:hypothetical protein